MSQTGARGCKENALNKARALGVSMVVTNAWLEANAPYWEKVMGTCLRRDNIWQLLPQPNLHGMDEGLNSKANLGILEAMIKEAKEVHNISATEVPSIPVCCRHECSSIHETYSFGLFIIHIVNEYNIVHSSYSFCVFIVTFILPMHYLNCLIVGLSAS
jgi:hypothetical protein